MTEKTEIPAVEVGELSQEDVREEIDAEAHERLGMSFEEFLAEYERGTLPDTLAANELVITLRFAGFDRNGT